MAETQSKSQAFRTEKDSMGEMRVPADAYYGAQTARAVENFPISNLRLQRRFIAAIGNGGLPGMSWARVMSVRSASAAEKT